MINSQTTNAQSLKSKIESLPEIKHAAKVLTALKSKGLKDPCIASGWIRGFLTNTQPSDIDIAYVGNVHFDLAQIYLKEILSKNNIASDKWDIKGIWNAQIEHHEIDSTEKNYLLFYVNSIDSVYLASDGKLYDPTGFGFKDALSETLRMNDFQKSDFNYNNKEIVYFCLEGCRRVAKFGWRPTKRSVELIRYGRPRWEKLSEQDKEYFYTKKIISKYQLSEFNEARKVYEHFGWGFVFDNTKNY